MMMHTATATAKNQARGLATWPRGRKGGRERGREREREGEGGEIYMRKCGSL